MASITVSRSFVDSILSDIEECRESKVKSAKAWDHVLETLCGFIKHRESVAVLRDENSRLRRILAVEQGDTSQYPPGWDFDAKSSTWHRKDGHRVVCAVLRLQGNVYRWLAYASDKHGFASSLLEAMESADSAST